MIRYMLIFIMIASLTTGCGIYASHDPAGAQGDGKNGTTASPSGQGKESKAPKK